MPSQMRHVLGEWGIQSRKTRPDQSDQRNDRTGTVEESADDRRPANAQASSGPSGQAGRRQQSKQTHDWQKRPRNLAPQERLRRRTGPQALAADHRSGAAVRHRRARSHHRRQGRPRKLEDVEADLSALTLAQQPWRGSPWHRPAHCRSPTPHIGRAAPE